MGNGTTRMTILIIVAQVHPRLATHAAALRMLHHDWVGWWRDRVEIDNINHDNWNMNGEN